MSPIVNSLWITLIGMGLVFIGLLLLWGLMELVVRFIKDAPQKEEPRLESVHAEIKGAAVPDKKAALSSEELKVRAAAAAAAVAITIEGGANPLKTRAAAAAVAVAMSSLEQINPAGPVFQAQTPGLSTWQAGIRAGQVSRRSVHHK